MDRQSSIDARARPLRPLALAGELVPALIAILLALECGIALFLVARRAQGAMTLTASPGWLILWMLLAAFLMVATRVACHTYYGHTTGTAAKVAWYAPLVALGIMALALTTLRTSPWVAAALWGIVVVAEVSTGVLWRGRGWEHAAAFVGTLSPGVAESWHGTALGRRFARKQGPADERPKVTARRGAQPDAGRAVFDLAATSARFAQRVERVQAVDGRDVLAGTLTTRLSAGQVTAHVHVAFCPPFAIVPRLDFRQAAGPTARIKLGQVLPHGARIDVKLDAPSPGPVFLELEIRATQNPEGAATDAHAATAG